MLHKNKKIQTIGMLTTGGDAPGLNAAIAGVVKAAYKHNIKVIGIHNADNGLRTPTDTVELKPADFNFYETKIAGTMLGTPYVYTLGETFLRTGVPSDHDIKELTDMKKNIGKLKLDAIVATGGDGGALALNEMSKFFNIPIIQIPKTVDNDIPDINYAIGFSTAVDVCVEAMDSTIAHAKSHARWMVIETMGRDAGHIALYAGIAGNADMILLPEKKYSFQGILDKIDQIKKDEKRDYGIIVVSEHAYSRDLPKQKNKYLTLSEQLAEKLKEAKVNARAIIVGHTQRAHNPNAFDRNIAFAYGVAAIDALLKGEDKKIIGIKDNKTFLFDLLSTVRKKNSIFKKDAMFLKTAQELGIYLGE